MKRALGAVLALLFLGSLVVAQQVKPRVAQVVTGATINQVFDLLIANQVVVSKGTNSGGSTYLSVQFGDWDKLYIDFFDCKGTVCGSLLLSAGFSLKKPPALEVINDFNYNYRFARAYLDEEGEAWVESDWSLEGGVVLEGLLLWLEDFASTVTDFADAIGYE